MHRPAQHGGARGGWVRPRVPVAARRLPRGGGGDRAAQIKNVNKQEEEAMTLFPPNGLALGIVAGVAERVDQLQNNNQNNNACDDPDHQEDCAPTPLPSLQTFPPAHQNAAKHHAYDASRRRADH